eukprot:6278617-Pyramimonas_sp.AAC.1
MWGTTTTTTAAAVAAATAAATKTTTSIMLRLFALICSRAIQYVNPKQSIPTLFILDRVPLGAIDLSYLQRVLRAASKAGEERTDGRKGQGRSTRGSSRRRLGAESA